MESLGFDGTRLSVHGTVDMNNSEELVITLPKNSGRYSIDITPLE